MSYPKTRDEWFALCEEHKDELRSLVSHYHPNTLRSNGEKSPPREPHEIFNKPLCTAPLAEVACERVRAEIREQPGDPLAMWDKALSEKDGPTLANLLNESWFGMPESMASREERCFGVLCDLCSECYLVSENELSPEEAQKAYDEAEPVPISEDRIQEIVDFATGRKKKGQ